MKRKNIKSLILKLAESIADLYEEEKDEETGEGFPDFDIEKAVKDGNYKFLADDYDPNPDKPSFAKASRFILRVYQKEENDFVHLILYFEKLGKCRATYFRSEKENDETDLKNYLRPEYTGKYRLNEITERILEITPEFLEKLENDESLKKIVADYVERQSGKHVDDCLPKQLDALKKIDIEENNKVFQWANNDKKEKNSDEAVKKYADERQKQTGGKYLYKEIENHGRIGSTWQTVKRKGEISLAKIALALRCRTEKDVDKLIDRLEKEGIIKGDWPYDETHYWKERDDGKLPIFDTWRK